MEFGVMLEKDSMRNGAEEQEGTDMVIRKWGQKLVVFFLGGVSAGYGKGVR